MEPEYEGFCRACNGYSTHLKVRIARNNHTGELVTGRFCDDCIHRYQLYPYRYPTTFVGHVGDTYSVTVEKESNHRATLA